MLRRAVPLVALALVMGGCRSDPEAVAAQFVARGNEYKGAGRFDAAAIEYRNAIKAQPRHVQAHMLLADAQQLQGRTTEAFRTLAKASAIDAANPRPQIEAGRMLLASGHAGAAQARAELVLEREPDNADAHVLLALARAAQRQWEEAETGVRAALARSPESVWAHVAAADVLLATNQPDEAFTHLQSAIGAAPGDELANRAMAAYLVESGLPEEAEPYFVAAAAQVPQRYRSSLALGDFYAAEGRIAEARAALNTAAQTRALSSQHSLIKQRLAKLAAAR